MYVRVRVYVSLTIYTKNTNYKLMLCTAVSAKYV